MLIYLDANIVQYCADYGDYVFGVTDAIPTTQAEFAVELDALRKLVELEQHASWTFAATEHLLRELHRGRPSAPQIETYRTLEEAWQGISWCAPSEASTAARRDIVRLVQSLGLRDDADRKHLVGAIALGASWFLTNDRELLERTKQKVRELQTRWHIRIARPSECLHDIAMGLFLR